LIHNYALVLQFEATKLTNYFAVATQRVKTFWLGKEFPLSMVVINFPPFPKERRLVMDKLEELFAMQAKLNDFVFNKQNLKDTDGAPLTMGDLIAAGKQEAPIGPNTITNQWLSNYLKALNDESRELGEELLWKWWSKDHLDMQNIRVEIVDQLHFWLSLAMCAGMDAQKVFDLYMQKNQVNLQRQQAGYSKATKNEADNHNIG
jgi:dimeric dUTPase (all-alpha-NTP-PPase superfamily)